MSRLVEMQMTAVPDAVMSDALACLEPVEGREVYLGSLSLALVFDSDEWGQWASVCFFR